MGYYFYILYSVRVLIGRQAFEILLLWSFRCIIYEYQNIFSEELIKIFFI